MVLINIAKMRPGFAKVNIISYVERKYQSPKLARFLFNFFIAMLVCHKPVSKYDGFDYISL
jgi:hypothetical protein